MLLHFAAMSVFAGQMFLLGIWLGLGNSRWPWQWAATLVACVYLATWSALANVWLRQQFAGSPWRGIDALVPDAALAAGLVVLALAGAFFVARWLGNELCWRPTADDAPSPGRIYYAAQGLALLMSIAVMVFGIVRGVQTPEPTQTGAMAPWLEWTVVILIAVAYGLNAFCAVWAVLGGGGARWRLFLVASSSLSLTIMSPSAIIIYGTLIWWPSLNRTAMVLCGISLVPIFTVIASLLAVRSCGYRLAPGPRARPRFSLRGLLAATAVLGAVLAMIVVPAERRRRAMALVKDHGGLVHLAPAFEAYPANLFSRWRPRHYFEEVYEINLQQCRNTDDVLAQLAALPTIRVLRLGGTALTNKGLAHLKRLRSLEVLDLDGTSLTDEGLFHLRELAGLRSLSLRGTNLTDAGTAQLVCLTGIEELDLSETRITDAALYCVGSLTNIKVLLLSGTYITDAGLGDLAALEALRELDLSQIHVTGSGLAQLRAFADLRSLTLDGAPVTDDGLSHIGPFQNLEVLFLSQTKVSDAGLVHLRGLSRLTNISLDGSLVTEEGVEELRDALPDAEIIWP